MQAPHQRSVRRTILWALCGLTAATALAVGLFTSREAASVARGRALDVLAQDTRRTAAQLEAGYRRMAEDVRLLANTASLSGYLRSLGAGEPDPTRAVEANEWADRVAETFSALIAVRPEYTQVRLLEFAEGVPERARVDGRGDGAVRVPEEGLQRKAGEPYVALAASLGPGEVAFSAVTLNREHGAVTQERVPTIRAIACVGEHAGGPMGFLVINVDYRELIAAALDGVSPAHDLLVLTTSGASLRVARGAVASEGHFEERATAALHPYASAMRRGDTGLIELPTGLVHASLLDASPAVDGGTAWLALEAQPDRLLAESQRALATLLAGALVLVGVAFVIGSWIAARIARPLEEMAAELARAEAADELPQLAEDRADEIGALARSVVATTREARRGAARIQAIFDTAVDAVVTIDGRGTVLTANRATETLFGYATEEIIGNNVNMLMPQPIRGEHDGYLERYAHTGRPSIIGRSRKVYAQRKDGSTFPIDLSVSECSIDGERTFTGFVRDVSEREQVEAERTRLLDELERSNGELEDFAYVASHDLKAPLRVIDNTSKWLEEDLEDHLDEDTRESMDLLRNRVGRMEKLLDDLLEFARVGRTESADSDERSSGAELHRGLVELLDPPEGVALVSTPSFDELDVLRMPTATILHNLVSNALKHGGDQVTRIVLDGGQEDDFDWISVEDDGPGIPTNYQERVFRMFQTLRPRDEVEGSGMGLALVKKHVEVAGGHLSLRSEEGQGCLFRFTLPRTAAVCTGTHE